MPGQRYTIPQRNDDHYPLIKTLETSEDTYRQLLDEYTTTYSTYINNKALGIDDASGATILRNLVSSMGSELDTMNNIIQEIYQKGIDNQTLSAESSNALQIQTSLIDERMKQYNEVRNSVAHLVGEEKNMRRMATRNQYSYYLYFIFALALIVSIVILLMGGTLPLALFGILLVIGAFVGWETYKAIVVKSATKFSDSLNLDINPRRFKGTFHLLT